MTCDLFTFIEGQHEFETLQFLMGRAAAPDRQSGAVKGTMLALFYARQATGSCVCKFFAEFRWARDRRRPHRHKKRARTDSLCATMVSARSEKETTGEWINVIIYRLLSFDSDSFFEWWFLDAELHAWLPVAIGSAKKKKYRRWTFASKINISKHRRIVWHKKADQTPENGIILSKDQKARKPKKITHNQPAGSSCAQCVCLQADAQSLPIWKLRLLFAHSVMPPASSIHSTFSQLEYDTHTNVEK